MSELPPLPGSIRVGYRTYRVEEFEILDATSADKFGECDHIRGLIRVRMDLGPVVIANTLLHEVLHACCEVGGLQDDDKEERVVEVLSNQLTQVWRDNFEWSSWMEAMLTDV